MKLAEKFIRIAAFFVFFGRSWQFIFWDAPYRTLFWDEGIFGEVLPFILGVPWSEISTSQAYDIFISCLIYFSGGLFFLCALVSLKIRPKQKIKEFVLILGGLNLVFLSLLLCKAKFWYFGQFIEYTAQMSVPFLLISLVKKSLFNLEIILKIVMAATFIGHGLFAIGYYPVPGNFIDMVIIVFGLSEYDSRQFLLLMGVIDILASVCLFIPRLDLVAVYFMVFWGGVTSLARIVANIDNELFLSSLFQWCFETLFRMPHMLLSLAILVIVTFQRDRKKSLTIPSEKKLI